MAAKLLIAAVTGPFIDPTTYGVVADCRGVKDAAVAGGALSTVTSATAAFTSADTGKTYTLRDTSGNVTTGTLTYVNATTATMSVAAAGAITSGWLILGTDDTAAWQAALDAATPGQVVDCADPTWRSLCAGQLSVPVGVSLGLTGRGPFDPQTNPAMNDWGPTFVVVQSASTPFITLDTGSGLGDFIIYSANQVQPAASTPTAFAAMVYLKHATPGYGSAGAKVGNPYIPNAYTAILAEGGRSHIARPQIGALSRGVVFEAIRDVVDVEWITCHPYWRICEGQSWTPTAGTLDAWALSNGWGVEVLSADGVKINSIFTFGMYGGLLIQDSSDTSQSPRQGYGQVRMMDIDDCAYGIYVKSTNSPGFLIGSAVLGANGTGVGTAGQAGIITAAGGLSSPKVVLKSWSHRGSWAIGGSSRGAGTLIVPGTNPG